MKVSRIALACATALAFVGVALAQNPPAAVKPSTSLAPPPDAPPVKPTPPGPYKVSVVAEPSLMTHTVYRPTDLAPFKGGKRLPIVAWGNGACSNAGLLFETFLTEIASNGFMVIASGPKDAPLPAFARQRAGQPAPPPAGQNNPPPAMTKDADLIAAIDWAIKQTADKASPYYGKLDPNKVAVMGQSCGGLQATAVSGDPRIKTTVIWNSGVFRAGTAPPQSLSGATKDSLKKFHAPVAYFLGGPSDLAYENGKDDFSLIPSPGGVPAFLGSIHVGHGGTYNQPGGGRFGEVGVAWLKWRLNGDKAAGKFFDGPDCILCKDPIWETAKKNMK
jgi:hypothetical protein